IAIADPLFLGDLVLGSEVTITATPQFRIELWASLVDGVAAMLALASPPGHQVLIAALEGDCERLHLQFETPQAILVVALVDTDGKIDLPVAPPHGVIVAPPRGELIAMVPQRLAELTSRLSDGQETAVVTVGGHALQATVGTIVDEAGGPRHLGVATRGGRR